MRVNGRTPKNVSLYIQKERQTSSAFLHRQKTDPLKVIKNVQTSPVYPAYENRAFEHMKLLIVQSLLA
ncbi:hypothetical protein E2626_11340 [Jeotgalibacillus salarius]|uniref:Uncharacterized protein n=1 Tax=Jeotgalibacillus salarius TaxID=546023 RepID=A0A4Y8LDM3_9BACL|nr:hypothetical protein E2626_11340 [Jeotgalibacillus salarius]